MAGYLPGDSLSKMGFIFIIEEVHDHELGFVRCSFIAIGFLHCSSRRLHFFSFSVILDACNVAKPTDERRLGPER